MAKSSIKEQLEAVQLKFKEASDTLKNSPSSLAPSDAAPVQFSSHRPSPTNVADLVIETSKSDGIAERMLDYILKIYGKEGRNILLETEENLLPHYIDGYLLKQQLKLVDNKDGKFHKILQLVHAAGQEFLPENKIKPHE